MTTVWPFRPQAEVIESYEWATDVHRCKLGERRICTRPIPRQGFIFRYFLTSDDYSAARALYEEIGEAELYVPDWPNLVDLGGVAQGDTTLGIDVSSIPSLKVGGKVLLWEENTVYEVCTIQSLGSGSITITATTRAYTLATAVPIRVGYFSQQLEVERGPTDYAQASATFDIVVTEDLTLLYGSGRSYLTYLGSQVVTDPIAIVNGAQESYSKATELLDSVTGPLFKYPIYPKVDKSSLLGWYLESRPEYWSQLLWVHSIKGRQKSFWCPSWNSDLLITRAIWNGDEEVEVAANNFSSRFTIPVDFAIISAGTVGWTFRVVGVEAGDPGKEILTLASPFIGNVALGDISSTCKLTLCRFSGDRVEFSHRPGASVTLSIQVQEVP